MTTKINSNLQGALNDINKRLEKTVTSDVNLFLQLVLNGISLQTAQYIPVDTSNLINSETQEINKSSVGFVATLEYTADYATYVHEAPGTYLGQNEPRDPNNPGRGDYWDPTGRPQFLVLGAQDFIEQDLDALIFRYGT